MDDENRPFDRLIKTLLGKPGVLLQLCKDNAAFDANELNTSDWNADDVHQPITWLQEEFRPSQQLWRADKIAWVGENSIIHVEQQTRHNARVMAGRMMQYATYISIYYDYRIRLFQLYYYTGDAPISWKVFERTDVGAITNRFSVIDAGEHEAWSMLNSENFNYAVLGLLSRGILNEEAYLTEIVRWAIDNPPDGDQIGALVDCIGVASLRCREEKILRRLDAKMAKMVTDDPIFRAMFAKGHSQGVKDGRQDAGLIYQRVETLKTKVRGPFPISFMNWAMTSSRPSEIEALEMASASATTFDELIEIAGIEWEEGPRVPSFG
ncbi:hypothetical protein [Rhodopseudomonas telluris]|uniref:Transposase n=1 Tax=Rhodopseudomonas telluris TaxID=644215 RepID=A0ABV6EYE8_9BRAD